MQTQIIYGDGNVPLGINLVPQGDEDNEVLQKFQHEGMLPVSYSPAEGLVVAFGHPIGAKASEEAVDDITPTEASHWVG